MRAGRARGSWRLARPIKASPRISESSSFIKGARASRISGGSASIIEPRPNAAQFLASRSVCGEHDEARNVFVSGEAEGSDEPDIVMGGANEWRRNGMARAEFRWPRALPAAARTRSSGSVRRRMWMSTDSSWKVFLPEPS